MYVPGCMGVYVAAITILELNGQKVAPKEFKFQRKKEAAPSWKRRFTKEINQLRS